MFSLSDLEKQNILTFKNLSPRVYTHARMHARTHNVIRAHFLW